MVTAEPIGAKLTFMHMRWIRKVVLIWMIVWLPMAGAMAVVMPLKGPTNPFVSINADSALADDDGGFVMPCHGKVAGKLALGQSCTHCVLCHLAGALATARIPEMATVPPTHVFESTPLSPLPSFVPDLLVPPPRTTLA